jgi:hypothetical protein
MTFMTYLGIQNRSSRHYKRAVVVLLTTEGRYYIGIRYFIDLRPKRSDFPLFSRHHILFQLYSVNILDTEAYQSLMLAVY